MLSVVFNRLQERARVAEILKGYLLHGEHFQNADFVVCSFSF